MTTVISYSLATTTADDTNLNWNLEAWYSEAEVEEGTGVEVHQDIEAWVWIPLLSTTSESEKSVNSGCVYWLWSVHGSVSD